MTRKTSIPRFPESYVGEKSKEYDNSKSMERNQKKTTLLLLEHFFDDKLDLLGHHDKLERRRYMFLDLGCGSGFSSEVLLEMGYRVIGIDLLDDMIQIAREKRNDTRAFHGEFELILANINKLPFRNNSIDHAISVSAYNFILHGPMTNQERSNTVINTAISLNTILKSNSRLIIEFYPQDDRELSLFTTSFIENGFNGYMIKKNPKQKSGQTFLLLKKNG
jgi:18S rRNA (guanine1575-N7)-methyltransferase